MEHLFDLSLNAPTFMPIYTSSACIFYPKYSRQCESPHWEKSQNPLLCVTTELPPFQMLEIPIYLYLIMPCRHTRTKRKITTCFQHEAKGILTNDVL